MTPTWDVTSRGPSYRLRFCKVFVFLFFLFLFFWGAESVTAFGPVTNIERVTWKWKSLFLRSPQEFESLSRNYLEANVMVDFRKM